MVANVCVPSLLIWKILESLLQLTKSPSFRVLFPQPIRCPISGRTAIDRHPPVGGAVLVVTVVTTEAPVAGLVAPALFGSRKEMVFEPGQPTASRIGNAANCWPN